MTRNYKLIISLTVLVGIAVAGVSLASHQDYLVYIQDQAAGDRSDCEGSHCSVIATYFIEVDHGSDTTGIHVTMSMDTLLDQFNLTGLVDDPPHDVPATFQVPIDASGEIVGHAVAFYDSPPIFFEANGQVRAVTDGLRTCSIRKQDADPQNPISCQDGGAGNLGVGDIIGTWEDTWVVRNSGGAVVNDVECQTASSGTAADCTAAIGADGLYTMELTRTVDAMNLGGVPSLRPDSIFPVSMTDSLSLQFGEGAAANQPPIAEAGVSVNGGSATNTAVVVKGQPVQLALTASQDVTGDGLGSRDPDGWNTPILGMSNGGKCEWNTDLDQGPPSSYEELITNPASPAACDVLLGTVTFNDDPGTYTYNVLRMSDAPGGVDTATISITVLPVGSTPPPPSPSQTPTPDPDPDEDITICHFTGSVGNPFQTLVVPFNSSNGHFNLERQALPGHGSDLLLAVGALCPGNTPECADELDNDGDGETDCEDNGCWTDPSDSTTCDPDDNSELFIPDFDPGPFQETE